MTRLAGRAVLALTSILAAPPLQAQDALRLDTVTVEADRLPEAATSTLDPHAAPRPPAADGAAFLRDLPGLDAGRMGGHGLEPVIRGQSQTQLNIVVDDAWVHGGCPNRMDPPTAYAPAESFDSITVVRGYQSVRYGAGGTGGTVLFQREPVTFAPGEWWQGRSGASYDSNGVVRGAWADAAAGTAEGQVRGFGMAKKAENYEDGAGRDVRSAFNQLGGGLMTAWTPRADSSLTLGVERQKITDALYAGATMDAPESESTIWRAGLKHRLQDAGPLRRIEASAYHSGVDHVMDNYSLRSRTTGFLQAPTQSDTSGGRLAGELALGEGKLELGLDAQHLEKSARRYRGATAQSVTILQSVLWPDASITQTGAYAEATLPMAETSRVIAGLRYDHVVADADAADQVGSMPAQSPNQLYAAYAGTTAEEREEHNLGGLLRLEWDLDARTMAWTGLSRSVRTADVTERFMASNSTTAASRWVGNPGLQPEKHYQWDAGLAAKAADWSLEGSLYADRVRDYILRTRAADRAAIYRNSEALLLGGEMAGRLRLVDRLWAGAQAGLTWGENLADDRALAQIPPLQGSLSLAWEETDWTLGTRLRGAAKQGRIDPVGGQDADETAGWMVQDLFASYDFGGVSVGAGVTNLFDADYARHLNRAASFDPTVEQVSEPGRSLYMTVNARF